jgi:hypothetical protein
LGWRKSSSPSRRSARAFQRASNCKLTYTIASNPIVVDPVATTAGAGGGEKMLIG